MISLDARSSVSDIIIAEACVGTRRREQSHDVSRDEIMAAAPEVQNDLESPTV